MCQILVTIVTIVFAEIGVCEVVPEGFIGDALMILACIAAVIVIVIVYAKAKPVVYVNDETKKVNSYRKHRRQHHR